MLQLPDLVLLLVSSLVEPDPLLILHHEVVEVEKTEDYSHFRFLGVDDLVAAKHNIYIIINII